MRDIRKEFVDRFGSSGFSFRESVVEIQSVYLL